MKKSSKYLAIAGMIITFFFIFGLITAVRQQSGNKTPGFFGTILLFGLIFGIRAIWKYEPPKDDSSDNTNLDKTI